MGMEKTLCLEPSDMSKSIYEILDILESRLEKELALAEKNPVLWSEVPAQTKKQIQFFIELSLHMEGGA